MMEGVTMMRQAVSVVTDVVDTGLAYSSSAYYQLTQEDNLPARVGVITGAGLLGLAVGVARGRLVKRVVYTMVGAGGGAAFCYPQESRDMGDMVYQEGRNNILQAYNIITGASTPPSLPEISGKSDMSISPAIIETTGRSMMLLCITVGRKMKEFYPLIQQKVATVMNPEKDEKNAAIETLVVPKIAVDTNKEVEK